MIRTSAVAIDSRRSHARLQAVDVGACLYRCFGSVQPSLFDRRHFAHLGPGPDSGPDFRAVAPADRASARADRTEFENR